jgi:hypothetical protein
MLTVDSLHSSIDSYGQVEKLMRLKKLRELHEQKQQANKD